MSRKTKAELQADLKKTQDALSTPPTVPTPTPTPPEPVTPTPIPNPEPTPVPPTPEPIPPSPAPSPAPAAPPIHQPEVDPNKKKLIASQQEGIILHSQLRNVSKAIKDAVTAPEPTEDELRAKYPNWDTMDDDMRLLVRDNFKNNRVIHNLTTVTKESEDIEAWDTKVKDFVENPEVLVNNPELEGKQDDFKIFATKETRRNLPFEDLLGAFFHEEGKKTIKHKGQQIPAPTPGPTVIIAPKEKKMTIDEGIALRKSNFKAWVKAMKENKIERTVL